MIHILIIAVFAFEKAITVLIKLKDYFKSQDETNEPD